MLQRVRDYRFEWQDRVFEIGASIGVVMIDDTSGSLEDVLRKADAACYAVKHSGRNRVHLFQPCETAEPDLPEKT
jgi:GGDEF domain-containing protein